MRFYDNTSFLKAKKLQIQSYLLYYSAITLLGYQLLLQGYSLKEVDLLLYAKLKYHSVTSF